MKVNGKDSFFMELEFCIILIKANIRESFSLGFRKDMGWRHGIQLKGYNSTKDFGNKEKWREKGNSHFQMEKSISDRWKEMFLMETEWRHFWTKINIQVSFIMVLNMVSAKNKLLNGLMKGFGSTVYKVGKEKLSLVKGIWNFLKVVSPEECQMDLANKFIKTVKLFQHPFKWEKLFLR